MLLPSLLQLCWHGVGVSQAVLGFSWPLILQSGAVRMAQLGSLHPRVLLFNGVPGSCPYTKHQPKASRGCVWFPIFSPVLHPWSLPAPPAPGSLQLCCWADGEG